MNRGGGAMSASPVRYAVEASSDDNSNSNSHDSRVDPAKVQFIQTQIENDVRCLPAPSQLFKQLLHKTTSKNQIDKQHNSVKNAQDDNSKKNDNDIGQRQRVPLKRQARQLLEPSKEILKYYERQAAAKGETTTANQLRLPSWPAYINHKTSHKRRKN